MAQCMPQPSAQPPERPLMQPVAHPIAQHAALPRPQLAVQPEVDSSAIGVEATPNSTENIKPALLPDPNTVKNLIAAAGSGVGAAAGAPSPAHPLKLGGYSSDGDSASALKSSLKTAPSSGSGTSSALDA